MNTELFEDQSYDTLTAHPFFENTLTGEVALSKFFIGGMLIHQSMTTGDYFYYTVADDQQEFIYFDEPAIVNELTPVSESCLSLIETMEESKSILASFHFHLFEVKYVDKIPMVTMYDEDLQVWIQMDENSFSGIKEHTYAQIVKLNLALNTFVSPHRIKIDSEGNLATEG